MAWGLCFAYVWHTFAPMGCRQSLKERGAIPAEPAMASLNALELIRSSILRRDALHAAQLLQLKTYRGVPYDQAPHSSPQPAELTYRGIGHHVDR